MSTLKEVVSKFKGYIGFVNLVNYTNSKGEVANVLINVGYKYANIKKDDLKALSNGVEYIESDKYSQEDWDNANSELIESLVNPNENRSKGQTEAYISLNENSSLKWHGENESLKITGLVVRKTVKVEGNYPTVNSRSKTIAKNKIKKEYLKTGKIRYYTVADEKIDKVNIDKDTLQITF